MDCVAVPLETTEDNEPLDAPLLLGSDPPIVVRNSTTVPKTVPPQLAVTPDVMIAMTVPRQAQVIEDVRTRLKTPCPRIASFVASVSVELATVATNAVPDALVDPTRAEPPMAM